MKIYPFLLAAYLLTLSPELFAQKLSKKSEQVSSYKFLKADSVIVLNSQEEITAVAITSKNEELIHIILDDQLIVIPRDQDAQSPAYFISLESPRTKVTLKVPSNATITIHLISSGSAPYVPEAEKNRITQNLCDNMPSYVSQETWRAGLPEPNYSRSFHRVNHNVVHHSAGSNSNENYTQVIRDIYIYHTQVNGWSDIGYNYLIAQDGLLFAGRDPGNGSQDAVRGAHFCGSNTGTLGICLLGNYETATPSLPALSALESLLTYQLVNQELDPFEQNVHPLGNLGTIIGHRDGCATLCPGENVYRLLDEIRSSVAMNMEQCQPATLLSIGVDSTLVQVNEIVKIRAYGGYEKYQWLLPGAKTVSISRDAINVRYGRPGFFDITLIGVNESQKDTLIARDFLQVSQFSKQPLVFPNPVFADRNLTIDMQDTFQAVTLHDIKGQLIQSWDTPNFRLVDIKSGLYFLTIKTETETYRQKLVIL